MPIKNRNVDILALILPEIRDLVKERNFQDLKEVLRKVHSVDLALSWNNLDDKEKPIIFRLLGARKSVELFEDLPIKEQTHIINNLNNEEVTNVLNEMAPDERADLFKDLSEKDITKFIKLLKKEDLEDVRRLMNYQEGTAGSLMTTELVELKKDMSARGAILYIQDNLRTEYNENVYSCYVTDTEHKLLGVVTIQDLLKSPADMLLRDIMISPEFIKIDVNTDISEVANIFKRYDLHDAPIVDNNNIFLGIVTIDDIVDEIEKENTKEIYEIGKMSGGEGEIISYSQSNAFDLVKRRAGWLIFLLVFDFLTGTVLKAFEHSLSSVVALAFFIPMLLDTGGNAGAQTSITIIRGLATGDVSFKNIWKVVKMELCSAIFIGLIIGTVAFARAFLLQKDFMLSVVVGITMVLVALLAIITGVTLPLASKRIGLDPAALAGPITTSIVDVLGLIIYFKIAQMFIPALKF